MDPVSQGLLGASFSQSAVQNKKLLGLVGLIGFAAGMAPDLDILIRSQEDPLLFLEFHRQFTHALVFIPFGGLICASLFFLFSKIRQSISFKKVWIFSTIGYGTHGLLDGCTSYGTLLFWPFSYERISWNNISIIDPLFTVPLIIFVFLSIYLRKVSFARFAVIWALFYLAVGLVLNDKALDIGKDLADDRGHQVDRIVAKPTFANLFLWKVIYESNGKFYTDGVRLLPRKKIFSGASINKLNISRDFAWLDNTSQQARDIKRFNWFSQDYLAASPEHPNQIIDIRYSLLPNQISGLWGIELNKSAEANEHIKYVSTRNISKGRFKDLLLMIFGD